MTYKIARDAQRKIDLLLPQHLRLCWVQFLGGHIYYAEQLNEVLAFIYNIFSGQHKYITCASDSLIRKLIDEGIIMAQPEEETKPSSYKAVLKDPNRKWPTLHPRPNRIRKEE